MFLKIKCKTDQAVILTKFDVYFDKFSVTESSILGLTFLREKKAVLYLN